MRRYLHKFNELKPEVVIGSHASVFALLATLARHGKEAHPDVRLIYPGSWFDHFHPDHNNKEWGQTVLGLPKIARDLFASIYPTHSNNDYVKWEQLREVKNATLELLTTVYEVPIYYGEPSIEVSLQDGFKIRLIDLNSEESYEFFTPSQTHFYLWHRIPRKHQLMAIPQRPSTEIYQISTSLLPHDIDIVVLGAGLSVVWLAKHFATPTRKIVCLKRESDQLDTSIPANRLVDYEKIIQVDLEKATVSTFDDDPTKRLVLVDSKEHNQQFLGLFYSALGFVPALDIVKNVPDMQVTRMQTTLTKWIAPKNIPVGSLMQSILHWFETTDNLEWAFELQGFHETGFPDLLRRNISVEIGTKYFDTLEKAIQELNNPLPDKVAYDLLVHIYENTQNPTKAELSIFERQLRELIENRLAFNDSLDPNYHRTLSRGGT